jgi:hypothetical protein
MRSLLIKSQVYLTSKLLEASVMLFKRCQSSKFAPKVYEGFFLDYDSNSHSYHVFNKDSGCVEIICDAVFDETNGS